MTNERRTVAPSEFADKYYIDPVDEWIAEQSSVWSEKYPGKFLAIIDCQVVAVKDTREEAFRVFDPYPNETPFVWYVPTEEELDILV